jgi:Uma2 family endonuclease
MGAAPIAKVSVHEYLAAERTAGFRSEYHDGEVFPMEGASVAHAVIALNTGAILWRELRNAGCRALAAPMLQVSPDTFLYPDLAVVCGKPNIAAEGLDLIADAKVILEVLSPSTEGYNHGGKFALYRQLASFEEYVLIAQSRPGVQVFRRTPEGRWIITLYDGLEAVAKIESLDIALSLAKLYEGVLPKSSTAGN